MILKATDSPNTEYVELESGLIVPETWAEQVQRPRAVDLFCGAGGFSLGMIQAGWHIVAAVDNDPLCAHTYMYNLGSHPCQFWFIEPEDRQRMEKALATLKNKSEKVLRQSVSGSGWISGAPAETPGVNHFFLGDIFKLKGSDILNAIGMKKGELDCVCGSPPCQGFSTAGHQRVEDPRNSLVFEFARLILELMPKTMVFENVPGILQIVTPDGVPVIDAFSRILEDGGFSTMDALKRTLKAQTGTFGAMRGQRGKEKKTAKISRPKQPIQKGLFPL